MDWKQGLRRPGVAAALGAALLFGAGTPLAKLLLDSLGPWLLAGLFYLGSGLGLTLYRRLRHAPPVRLPPGDTLWFAGSIVVGGLIAPLLLMFGLTGMPSSAASLLLNAEGVFNALLAWLVFKEHFGRRIALGMTAILAGALVLSWPGETSLTGLSGPWPALAVLGACFAWAIDNNLTRKVSLADATWIASVKGLTAGSVNLALAFALGAAWPPPPKLALALGVGLFAYGVSMALFVIGLRHLGAARTGAYFSVAPFFGAALALALGEPVTTPLLVAGILMSFGIWLHLTERHGHEHLHPPLEHSHPHRHDEHHQHAHQEPVAPETRHSHRHHHQPLTHDHPHSPDAHHWHDH